MPNQIKNYIYSTLKTRIQNIQSEMQTVANVELRKELENHLAKLVQDVADGKLTSENIVNNVVDTALDAIIHLGGDKLPVHKKTFSVFGDLAKMGANAALRVSGVDNQINTVGGVLAKAAAKSQKEIQPAEPNDCSSEDDEDSSSIEN